MAISLGFSKRLVFSLTAFTVLPVYAAAESIKIDRSPAVHGAGIMMQAEPEYCSDLAQNFCPRIPNLRKSEDVVADYSREVLQPAIRESDEIDARKHFFEYLKKDLLKKGYPLKPDLKAAALEDYYSQALGSKAGDLLKIFDVKSGLCEEANLAKTSTRRSVLEDIEKISAIGLPSDESFDILRSSRSNEDAAERDLKERVQKSQYARNLLSDLGDYDVTNGESRGRLGKSYAVFLDQYSADLSKLVIDSRRKILDSKSKLQEFSVLCHLLKKDEVVSSIAEDECDVSSNLDILQIDGVEFGVLKSSLDLDRTLVDLRRKIWLQYESYLRKESLPTNATMASSFTSWKSLKIRDESAFLSALAQQANTPQVKEDIDNQLMPAVYENNVMKVQNQLLCRRRLDLYQLGLQREFQYVDRMIQRSEPAVQVIQHKLFPSEDMQELKDIFKSVSERSINQFQKISSSVNDPMVANRFLTALKNLEVYDPANVKDVYMVDPYTGLRVIDYTRVSNYDSFFNLFLDKDMSDLGVLNASLESGHMAQLGNHPGIFMSPAYVKSYLKNRASLFFLLTHEMAHSMGPDVFRDVGLKFPDGFSKVLKCLSDSQSAGAKPHQYSECFSDWFATEVLATTIGDVEPDKRFAFAQDALVSLCELSDEGAMPRLTQGANKASGKFLTDVHLSPRKRINTIIGAHPTIREALGCHMMGKYPYCALSNGVER